MCTRKGRALARIDGRRYKKSWLRSKGEREVEQIYAFTKEAKTISPAALGQGKPNDGKKSHQKQRFKVLDRLRDPAWLTP